MNRIFSALGLALVCLLSFTATAFAAGAAAPDEGSILDLLRPVWDAFRNGQYVAGGALAVVLVVALARRYAPGKIGAWLHTDVGGAACTLVVSFAGTVGVANMLSWSIVANAATIAFVAAGGYATVKKLVVDPIRASAWYAKAPAWVRSILQVVFWIFDKPSPVEEAEKAGDAAVAANPSPGADSVVGKPEKF